MGTARTDDFVGHTGIGPLSCQPLTINHAETVASTTFPETAAPDGLTPTLFKLLVYGLHDQTKLTREDFREIGAREWWALEDAELNALPAAPAGGRCPSTARRRVGPVGGRRVAGSAQR